MALILLTGNGKRVEVVMDKDLCLYRSPVNPPNTGTTYTRGTHLYAHVTRKGNVFYYKHSWSMWQEEEDSLYLVSKEEAIEFLQAKAASSGWDSIDRSEAERIVEHFEENIFEEDA